MDPVLARVAKKCKEAKKELDKINQPRKRKYGEDQYLRVVTMTCSKAIQKMLMQ